MGRDEGDLGRRPAHRRPDRAAPRRPDRLAPPHHQNSPGTTRQKRRRGDGGRWQPLSLSRQSHPRSLPPRRSPLIPLPRLRRRGRARPGAFPETIRPLQRGNRRIEKDPRAGGTMNFSLTTSGELLLRASWQAGILAVIIFVAQWLAASRISARWRYNLWMLVVLRLLLPIVPSTQWSVHNWIALPKKSPQQIPQQAQPIADLSVIALESAAEPIPLQPSPPRLISKPPPKTWRDYAIPAACLLWLAGFSFFFLRTLTATARLRKQSRQFQPVTAPQILNLLDTARQRMRIR